MNLYDRLASTPEGAKGLAVARLKNEIYGAIADAWHEAKNASPAATVYVDLNKLWNDELDIDLETVAEIFHQLGKEIMITVVPAGEPRRISNSDYLDSKCLCSCQGVDARCAERRGLAPYIVENVQPKGDQP